MTRFDDMRKRSFVVSAVLLLLLTAVPSSGIAKGFSGGGGSRTGGFRSSGFGGKSFSFSGSSARRTTSYRPSYDRAAGTARAREISLERFNLWKTTRGIQPPRSFDPMLSQTRQERMTRDFATRQPTGYYREPANVVIYRDGYDNSFMKYATMMWLFNHWNSVDRSRFDQQRLRDLETRFRDLEARGYKPDPEYREPGIDPDLAYRSDVAYRKPGTSPVVKLFWGILTIGFVAWLVWFIFIRRIPYERT